MSKPLNKSFRMDVAKLVTYRVFVCLKSISCCHNAETQVECCLLGVAWVTFVVIIWTSELHCHLAVECSLSARSDLKVTQLLISRQLIYASTCLLIAVHRNRNSSNDLNPQIIRTSIGGKFCKYYRIKISWVNLVSILRVLLNYPDNFHERCE